jgi:hypothetical protein
MAPGEGLGDRLMRCLHYGENCPKLGFLKKMQKLFFKMR